METSVRNNPSMRTPLPDTVFLWIKEIASEPGSHIRKGSGNVKRTANHPGINAITELIYRTIRMAIPMGAFRHHMNVAIEEGHEPCHSIYNWYLINAPFHKFGGTNRAYRFTTIESVKRREPSTLSVGNKDLLDGTDNASEVYMLLKHASSLRCHDKHGPDGLWLPGYRCHEEG